MKTISLDKYRTPGVKIYSGYDRGLVVAKAIKDEYGEDIQITVPSDVYAVSRSFQRGLNRILPGKLIWKGINYEH